MIAAALGDVLLSISGSMVASILVKATVTTTVALIAVRLARRAPCERCSRIASS